MIVVEPGEEIQADNIRKILGKESTVYYSDGNSKLGVFFDTAHRQYVDYDMIPIDFVNALVASEDDRFFQHFGFDLVGISRAMIKNIQAGRVVQGGSTLTQQTAKNLFKRTERSYEAKLKELIYALRLEYYYPKEKIFEFYANQFYVSGNGHGLGVAARYYFDKLPEELTLVECAFIAGSVKRPNYYNPFRGKSEERYKLATKRAKIRLEYVLGKMRQLGMIDTVTYNGGLNSDLNFNNGKVGYTLDHAMELVRDAVSSTQVRDALEKNGISNIATSGIRVVTTIDKNTQVQSLAILRGELSRLDVRLRGYKREEVQEELSALKYTGDSAVAPGAFLFGTIESIEGTEEQSRVVVSLDKKLGTGVIDNHGLKKLTGALAKYSKNRWTEPDKKDLLSLLAELEEGDRVWVSVSKIGEEVKEQLVTEGDEKEADVNEEGSETVLLSLERYPLLQGASLVMQQGRIKALAGGSENRFFNRAVHAKRTMGSAFKPLVYTAAIQLGWNSADMLLNKRNVFVFHDQPYFPRPDHKSPHDWVSMSWAGVHSENVASVWLLSKLCEKLTPIQFREVAEQVGLVPKYVDGEPEPYRSYKSRIRDKHGIQVNRAILRETAYGLAVKNLELDFIFDNMLQEYQLIKNLHYGLNFDKYSEILEQEYEEREKPVKKSITAEYELRKTILSINFLKLEQLRADLNEFRQRIAFAEAGIEINIMDSGTGVGAEADQEERPRLYYDGFNEKYYFLTDSGRIAGVVPVSVWELRRYLDNLDGREVAEFWKNISFENNLNMAVFDQLRDQVEEEYQKLLQSLPYQFNVLENVKDFRITVGLYYLKKLSSELGIKSNLEPVLSFPLGSNVVSLLEATRMYEGLVTGRVSSFHDSAPKEIDGFDSNEINGDALAIIDRIESEDGEILYQPEVVQKQVVDEKSSLMVGSILENIVKFGTGRYAHNNVKFTGGDGEQVPEIEELSLSVPLLGKTGTANNYTNAAFLGFVPEVSDSRVAMDLSDGYAVGVYVGFDKNMQMRRKTTRVSGAVGALPAWSKIANLIQKEQHYARRLDPVDLSFYGLGINRKKLGQINLLVDPKNGGKVVEPAVFVADGARMQPSVITFGTMKDSGEVGVDRLYEPVWKVTQQP